jgi:RND family efflux transporter MFP subunit
MGRQHRFVTAAASLLVLAGAARGAALGDYAGRASCLIGPNKVYKLSISTQGTLALVAVDRSDKVVKGQIVAQLESGVEQSQVEAARLRASTDVIIRLKSAVHSAATAKLERLNKLRVASITSQQTVEDAESAVALAQSEVEQAELDRKLAGFEVQRLEATLERRTLRAPADGVVTAVDLHPGEFADPATPVATITEIDPLKVAVYLPADAYSLVSVGARARVTPKETSSNAREAVVATKDPQIDASSGLFLIQLKMPNPDGDIPAGVRCSIEFLP